MAEALKVTIELAALDNGSKVINLALDKVASKAASVSARVSKVSFDIAKRAALVGGLIAAPLAYGVNQAIAFEDAMGDVSKVAGKGYEIGSAGLAKLSTNAKNAATVLGIGAENAAQLMESLASGGIAQKDLAGMTVTAGKIGIAYKMAAADAGDAFVKMRNALGATNAVALETADAINKIADRGASTPAEILAYMAQGGASVARTLGISGAKIATFGSQLIGMGKSGEEAATIMRRFQIALYMPKNADMLKSYKDAGRGAAGLMAVLKKGGDIKNVDKQAAYFMRMGQYGSSVSQLAKSYASLQENMNFVNTKSNYAGSVEGGFINRQKTVKGQLNKLKAEAGVLAVDLGTTLLPVIRDLVKAVAPLLTKLGVWIKDNPTLTTQIIKGAAAASLLSFGISGLSSVVGVGSKAVGAFSNAAEFLGPKLLRAKPLISSLGGGIKQVSMFGTALSYSVFPRMTSALWSFGSKISGVFSAVSTGVRAMGVATLTNPIFIAIAAAVVGGYLIYKNWDRITGALKRTGNGALLLAGIMLPMVAIPLLIIKNWDKFKNVFINIGRTIRNVAVGSWDYFVFAVSKAWNAVKDFGNIVLNKLGPVGIFIRNMFGGAMGYLSRLGSILRSLSLPDWLKKAANWVVNVTGRAAASTANFADNAAAARGISRNAAPRAFVASPMLRAQSRNAAAGQLTVASSGSAIPASAPPVPSNARGGGIVVNYNAKVVVPPGTPASQQESFKNQLRQNQKEVARVVAEANRQTGRSKFE